MAHTRHLRSLLFTVTLLLPLLASCRDQIGSPDPGTSNTPLNGQGPGVGSSFLLLSRDSLSQDRVDSIRAVVTERGSMQGKSNVIRMQIDSHYVYIAYEANGDISAAKVYGTKETPVHKWDVYPTGGGSIVAPVTDDSDGQGNYWHRTYSRSYAGTEPVSVIGKTYQAIRIRDETFEVYWNSQSGTSDTTFTQSDHWWVMSLGFVAKESTTQVNNGKVFRYDLNELVWMDLH